MSRPKIKTALVSVFILIGIIVGGFSAYSVDRLKVTNEFVNNIANDWMPSVALASRMQQDFSNIRLAYRDHIMALDDSGMKTAEASVMRGIADLLQTTSQFERIYTYQRELDLAKQVRENLSGYTDLGVKLMKMSADDNDEGAKVLLANDMKPLADKIAVSIDELIEINATGATKTFAASQEVFGTTLIMTFAAIGVCAVVLLASIWFALSGIARPIHTITGAMTKLAAGDTQAAVPYAGRADEIGEMAGAVEVFRQAALSNKRLEEEAEAARIQSEADRIRLTAEAEAVAQARLQEATSGLAAGLRRLAAGDLGFQLNEPFASDFEALRLDLNGAVGQLAETLRAVAHSTTQIDSGTREISQSTDDLSKRTEQQAASLEETAAALDQITVNVSNSSKRAEEARSVAVQANASAAHSGTVVASAVDAMQKIEQSSNQVSSIIAVIDEIAFQTNLLALNAGVEAARAGEAGKGFAVVAQEVRELAQRSAKAAKEIKELIRNSSIEVQSGVKLVSETGEALKTIESLIVAVNQHMDAIATSTREQSVGLAEVNTAVNQMDQVTQQNAAMVEESNAASATLAGEAGRLRELISQFQFGKGHSQTTAGKHSGTPLHSVTSLAGRPVARVA